MSQNIRATPWVSGRQGRTAKVERSGDHVGLLDRVEAGDRRAVEAHAALEGVVELVLVDREALQLAEDVGEPEPDEADVPLLDDGLDVVGGLRLIGHQAPPSRLDGDRLTAHGGTVGPHLMDRAS
jgi:hypothetical protein